MFLRDSSMSGNPHIVGTIYPPAGSVVLLSRICSMEPGVSQVFQASTLTPMEIPLITPGGGWPGSSL
jgi:hypothetical protein